MKTGDYWKNQGRKLPTQEEMTQLARDDYEKSDTNSKLATLARMDKIDKNLTSLSVVTEAIEAGKPVVFFAIGTTGMKADDEMMQLAIGSVNTKNEETKTFLFPVSKDVIARAEENTDYDIFANGGFDRPVEKNGLGISKKDYIDICEKNAVEKQAEYGTKRIYDFLKSLGFNTFKELTDNAVIVGLNPEFAKKFLTAKSVSLYKESIDILDVIKEYDYSHDDVLNHAASRYSLSGVVSQYDGAFNNGDGLLYSAANKVEAMKFILNEIENREHPKQTVKQETAEVTLPIQNEVVEDITKRAKELDELLSKLVKTFVDVLVVTTKTIENNTKAMQELQNTLKGDTSGKEEEEEEEEYEFDK